MRHALELEVAPCRCVREVVYEPGHRARMYTASGATCSTRPYCDIPGGTRLSDPRVRNGAFDPVGVRLWCHGNEMHSPWQIGHENAEDSGKLAAATAEAMRLVDPGIELQAPRTPLRAPAVAPSRFAEVPAVVSTHDFVIEVMVRRSQ